MHALNLNVGLQGRFFPLYSALKSKALKALETQDAAAQSREVTGIIMAQTLNNFCHVISSGFAS